MFDPQRLLELQTTCAPAAVCTVVGTNGSTPRKIGASMLVVVDGSPHGDVEGTIGGGAVEHRVREEALEAIATCMPRTVELALTTQLGMCCGGQMTVFIEPLRLGPPCLIFGGGHCGQALARVAAAAGFIVQVADPRDELLELFSDVRTFADYESEDLDEMAFGPDAFVVVVTHDHGTDQVLVERALGRPHRYLALVASERKARLTRQRCSAKGLDTAGLRSPAGIDIGAETPEEIAISIVAEMVKVRRAVTAELAESRTA